MANETLLPTSTTAADVNLSGDHTAVDDDPDLPGGDWRSASSNNTTSISAHGFNAPTGSPTTGAGLQNFKIYARLTANASSCTYNVYLSESGTRLNAGVAIATGSLTSTTGQLITAAWDAALLGTADGSLVECEFEVVKSGGSPASRTSGEVDAVEWNADYSAAATYFQTITASRARTVTGLTLSTFGQVSINTRPRAATTEQATVLQQVITATRVRTASLAKKISKTIAAARTKTTSLAKVIGKNVSVARARSPITSEATVLTQTITVTRTRLAAITTKYILVAKGLKKKIGKLSVSMGIGL